MVGFLRGVGLTLGVTLSADESCDGDGGSLVPYVTISVWCGAGTKGYNCNECNREGVFIDDV